MPTLVVTFEPGETGREAIVREVAGVADVEWLGAVPEQGRAEVLCAADAVLARNTAKELRDGEAALLTRARLLQFVSAGVDFIPLDVFPPALPIAGNGGAYAEPMAEHAVAMMLAAAKRLFVEHRNLERGSFNQFTPNRMLSQMTVGVLGFGGIGVAAARLVRALGARVHAVNRRGSTPEPVEWIGAPDALDALLGCSDVLLLSLPLTARSEGLIGARELGLMKPDAILVNLARGEIVDEQALYRHLAENPDFTACIDAWWIEPVRHGEFRMAEPFLSLPNVIASPHNSASTGEWTLVALGRAAANCRRALVGETPASLIGEDERAPRGA